MPRGVRRKIVDGRKKPEDSVHTQIREIYAALEQRDFSALQELAYRKHGFCSAELRRVVWTCLLGIAPEEAKDASWRKLLEGIRHDDQTARTMQADVQRSVYSWDVHTGIRKAVRSRKRNDLSEVMHAILLRHPGKLAYFQGFHDIALVFLEVGSPSQAFCMIERLALFCLSDQLCWPFERGLTPLLSMLFFLLEALDAPVAQALREAECTELHFTVPWVLTWFSHSLSRLDQVMRLFDCLLVSHPTMVLYFAAALILRRRDDVLQAPRELPEMMMLFQSTQWDKLDVDIWAGETHSLAQTLTPQQLISRLPPRLKRALPPTTPLLHFPHPWIDGQADRYHIKVTSASELGAMAPVYKTSHSPPAAERPRLNPVAFLWLISRWPALLCFRVMLSPLKALTSSFYAILSSRAGRLTDRREKP